MSKILPVVFDANEWFLIISICLIAPIPFFLPRRFPTIVTIVLIFLAVGIVIFFDFILGAPPNDLYDVNESGNHELFDILLYYLNVPFSYLFAYFFDKWRIRGLWISLYVLTCSVMAVMYEGLAVYCHVYKYKGWNIGYSFIFYVSIQSIYLLFYYLIKKKYASTKRESGFTWP